MEFIAANLIGIFAITIAVLGCIVPQLWDRIRGNDSND